MVMPIQVYKEEGDDWIAWDGQIYSNYIIYYCNKSIWRTSQTINIPVVEYPVQNKLEIRRNFILLNGDAKEPIRLY